MKELVLLDSIDSPVGNIYTKKSDYSYGTSHKYGFNMAFIPLTNQAINMALIWHSYH